MAYPVQCARTYINPEGNLAASGYYRSSLNQDIINMMPPWMHMRQNPNSIGQQFLSASTGTMKRLENTLNREFANKFINTAYIDEPDVFYRVKMPGNLNLLDTTMNPIRCVAAPSGCSPSGVYQISLIESNTLQDFYYDALPTRAEVVSSGTYSSSVDGYSWNVKPSGVLDLEESHVDIWGTKHDISWCYSNGLFRKQDVETLEDYETYVVNASGTPMDMWFYRGMLWWIGKGSGKYYLNLTSTKTQMPRKTNLDLLCTIDISSAFQHSEPSGIIIDQEGSAWVCDTPKTSVFEVCPRYDYFATDKNNRYIYLREDYIDSGVFISNT